MGRGQAFLDELVKIKVEKKREVIWALTLNMELI